MNHEIRRQSTSRWRVIVMDRGAILETGTHYSLMEQRGLYYYLNSQQSEG